MNDFSHVSALEALNQLEHGNNRYVTGNLTNHDLDHYKRIELVEGQNPYAIVLTCSDSRVVPEYIFDAGLGEIFVVRVLGNIATTEAIASMEYAVAHLGTKLIVVLGHESCGAVTAAYAQEDHGHHLNMLTAHIKPAIYSSSNLDIAIRINAEMNANRILQQSQTIKSAYVNNGLKVTAAYYSLTSGVVIFDELYKNDADC